LWKVPRDLAKPIRIVAFEGIHAEAFWKASAETAWMRIREPSLTATAVAKERNQLARFFFDARGRAERYDGAGIRDIREPSLHAAHHRSEGERALVAVAADENLVAEFEDRFLKPAVRLTNDSTGVRNWSGYCGCPELVSGRDERRGSKRSSSNFFRQRKQPSGYLALRGPVREIAILPKARDISSQISSSGLEILTTLVRSLGPRHPQMLS
jgi:hypothetical protein